MIVRRANRYRCWTRTPVHTRKHRRAHAHTHRRKTRARNTRPRRETLAKTGGGRDRLRDYSILHPVTGSGVYIERSGARGRRGGGHLSPPTDRYDARAKHPLPPPRPVTRSAGPPTRFFPAPAHARATAVYTLYRYYILVCMYILCTCTLCTLIYVYKACNIHIYIYICLCTYVGRGETPRCVCERGGDRGGGREGWSRIHCIDERAGWPLHRHRTVFYRSTVKKENHYDGDDDDDDDEQYIRNKR